MLKDKKLLDECRAAWDTLSAFRARRLRCRDFAAGRQWGDTVRFPDGRLLSEGRSFEEGGRIPVTNNLIRRVITQYAGKYRQLRSGGGSPGLDRAPGELDENDVRGFQEFLISGMALQRVGCGEKWLPKAASVCISPERVFFSRFSQPDASDWRFIGLLHDLSLAGVMMDFSGGRIPGAEVIMNAYRSGCRRRSNLCRPDGTGFDYCDSSDGLVRVIEVWRKAPQRVVSVFDPESGHCLTGVGAPGCDKALEEANAARAGRSKQPFDWTAEAADCIEHTLMLTDGMVLAREYLPADAPIPLVVRLYSMIDGEVSSTVESMIDQQKFINRLVMLLDDTLASAAKGVLLFPSDQLPEGLTWRDLRRLWSSPGAIIPFRRTSRHVQPRQVTSAGTSAGAAELLRTQLALFDEISGTGSDSSDSRATGADMLRLQQDRAAVAMLDVLSAYNEFICRRNALMDRLKGGEK